MKIINHRFQSNTLHRFLNGIFNLMVRFLQYFADILCYRTRTSLTRMYSYQGCHSVRLQCSIDLIQRNFRWILTQFCTTRSPGHSDESGFFQGTENIPDYNRIAAGTFSQKITGYLCNSLCFMNEYQAMNRNGAFHTYLHRSSISFRATRFSLFAFDVTLDIISQECYTAHDVISSITSPMLLVFSEKSKRNPMKINFLQKEVLYESSSNQKLFQKHRYCFV